MSGSVRLMARAAIMLAAAALVPGDMAVALAQTAPVMVTIDPVPNPTPAPQPSDPDRIAGIIIEGNGALITGPLAHRRVYIPLNEPVVPIGFRGVWTTRAELCAAARDAAAADPTKMPDGAVLVTDTELFGRKPLAVQKVYVPLPSSFTWAMLESGRPLVLPASRYLNAPRILAIYYLPDGTRDYGELTLLEKGGGMTMAGRNGEETGTRCGA